MVKLKEIHHSVEGFIFTMELRHGQGRIRSHILVSLELQTEQVCSTESLGCFWKVSGSQNHHVKE